MIAIGANILVEKVVEQEQKSSGLLLGVKDTGDLRYQKGIIKTLGSDIPVLKVDDVIYFDKARGYDITINGDNFTVIKFVDVVIKL